MVHLHSAKSTGGGFLSTWSAVKLPQGSGARSLAAGSPPTMFANRRRARRVVLVGLDGAGKTTIMRQLTEQHMSPGKTKNTLPTIGFTVREVVLRGVATTLFDVGGQSKMRELWPQYCHGADAIIVVVDSNDSTRLREMREELRKLLNDPENGLANAAMLMLANKQDQPHAMPPRRAGSVNAARPVSDDVARAGHDWH